MVERTGCSNCGRLLAAFAAFCTGDVYKRQINGFGRIGRLAFRQMFEAEGYEVVAINDLTSPKTVSYTHLAVIILTQIEQKLCFGQKKQRFSTPIWRIVNNCMAFGGILDVYKRQV